MCGDGYVGGNGCNNQVEAVTLFAFDWLYRQTESTMYGTDYVCTSVKYNCTIWGRSRKKGGTSERKVAKERERKSGRTRNDCQLCENWECVDLCFVVLLFYHAKRWSHAEELLRSNIKWTEQTRSRNSSSGSGEEKRCELCVARKPEEQIVARIQITHRDDPFLIIISISLSLTHSLNSPKRSSSSSRTAGILLLIICYFAQPLGLPSALHTRILWPRLCMLRSCLEPMQQPSDTASALHKKRGKRPKLKPGGNNTHSVVQRVYLDLSLKQPGKGVSNNAKLWLEFALHNATNIGNSSIFSLGTPSAREIGANIPVRHPNKEIEVFAQYMRQPFLSISDRTIEVKDWSRMIRTTAHHTQSQLQTDESPTRPRYFHPDNFPANRPVPVFRATSHNFLRQRRRQTLKRLSDRRCTSSTANYNASLDVDPTRALLHHFARCTGPIRGIIIDFSDFSHFALDSWWPISYKFWFGKWCEIV